jgi:hypothetical protein
VGSKRAFSAAETGMLVGGVLGLVAGTVVSIGTGYWWTLPVGLPVGAMFGLGIGAGIEQSRSGRR